MNSVASHLRQELVERGIGAVYSPQSGRGPEEGAADMAALTHWLREGDISSFLSQHRSADPNRAARPSFVFVTEKVKIPIKGISLAHDLG